MPEKIKYGLSNVHYAVLKDETKLTYDTPKPIKGAVNLSLSAEAGDNTFYADNIPYFVSKTNNGFTGDLEIALIPDEFLIDVLGYVKSATTGLLIEPADVNPKAVALLFQFENDTNSRKVALYHVTIGRPAVNHATKTENIEPQTDTLPITAIPVITEGHTFTKGTVNKEDAGYEDFFKNVLIPTAEDFTEIQA